VGGREERSGGKAGLEWDRRKGKVGGRDERLESRVRFRNIGLGGTVYTSHREGVDYDSWSKLEFEPVKNLDMDVDRRE